MTFDDEIGVALGVMGLSLETFLSLTPYQFQEAYDRFLGKTIKDREYAENVAWQVARWQVWRTLCPPKGTISVFDLIKLPGDELYKKEQKKVVVKDKSRFNELANLWK